MTTIKWKQVIFDWILGLLNQRDSHIFDLEEVYEFEHELSRIFPINRNIRPKIRQTLQRLRDDGLLLFQNPGHYELNLTNPDIIAEPSQRDLPQGTESPSLQVSQRHIRLRNTLLGMEMKRRYGNLCQVCGIPVRLSQDRNYSEAHHLRPLGSPHDGPDVPGNIIVLCPNHHVMFDCGAAGIVPGTLLLEHNVAEVFTPGMILHLAPWHRLIHKHIQYHHERIFKPGFQLLSLHSFATSSVKVVP